MHHTLAWSSVPGRLNELGQLEVLIPKIIPGIACPLAGVSSDTDLGFACLAGHQIMRISQYIIVFFGFFMGVLVTPATWPASVPGWLQLHLAAKLARVTPQSKLWCFCCRPLSS